MSNIIKGYKAFTLNEDKLFDRYGNEYETDQAYCVEGDIKFKKFGFHFCANMEDTLRYVNAFNDNVVIAEIIGFGIIDEYIDEYYEYGKMYSASGFKISKVFERDELIDYQINKSHNIKRFIEGYNLTLEELYEIISSKNENEVRSASIMHVLYHNLNSFKEFIDRINITDDEISMVLKYLPFLNTSDENKDYIRKCLGFELQKDKVRIRK